jgi:hypothetical protein
MIRFAIVGAGWRTEFFLRIVAALPERFAITSVVARRAERAQALSQQFGVTCVASLDDALTAHPDFVVTSLPWGANPEALVALHKQGIPTLSETPPAPNLPAMQALWEVLGPKARVQIAEQYPHQPEIAALIALTCSGKLGTPSLVESSHAHNYHAHAVVRRLLALNPGPVRVRATRIATPLVGGPGRNGPPSQESVNPSGQILAWIDFEEDRHAVYDFTGDQYFSWIRKNRLLVRGERGEADFQGARWLADFQTPVEASFARRHAGHGGNLEGFSLAGITLGESWLYKNPFFPARLADDELAIALCLEKMAAYAAGGESDYSLSEGLHDHHLGLTVAQAAQEGGIVALERMPWWK